MAIERGIDVSHWQGVIDWSKVAQPAADLKFAIVKIGGADAGLYTDAFGSDNLKRASQAGLETGAYWFFNRTQPLDAQAQRIDSLLLFANVPLERGLWIDVEGDITLADVKAAYTLIMALRVRGYHPGIYTRANIWNAAIAADPTLPTPDSLDIPLWVAHYKPPDVAGPIVPNGWARWTGWQFSAKGAVSGIAGDVDLDLWDSVPGTLPPQIDRGAPRLDYARVVHVAPEGATLAAFQKITEVAYKSDRQTVGFSYDDAGVGDLSSRKAVLWDIPIGKRATFTDFYAKWYPGVVVEFRSTTPEVTPPPISTRPPYRIGVHVIGNMGAADRAIAAGAKVIFAMHEHLGIHQRALANPHITFIYRGWVAAGQRPSPLDVLHHLQVGRDNPPNLWYVGTNENDHYGDDPDALRGRVLWDGELFHRLRDIRPDIRYFGGSFGHGCPGRIEDPNGPVVAALMGYAALWNEGMGIDLHNYEKGKRYPDDPPGDALIHDPIWYPKRGDFWFRNGILDPRVGGGFIHGETGVEAGYGGYNWAGYNQQQFGRSIRTLSEFGRAPIVVESGPYKGTWPSVDLAGAIFQMGNTDTGSGGWAGYNVENYLPELRTFWAEGR